MDIKALIAAHFGTEKSAASMQDSYEEILKVLHLLNRDGTVPVLHGAEKAMASEEETAESEGARFIVQEAMKEDSRPLYIAFLGPLTDMAAALKMEPKIAEKDVTVIWIGGRDWPAGGWEYNLCNDIHAANAVFKSDVTLWQVPRNVYRMMSVSFMELYDKVYPCKKLGQYLVDNVIAFNTRHWNGRRNTGDLEIRRRWESFSSMTAGNGNIVRHRYLMRR